MNPEVPPGECKLKSFTGTHIDFRFQSDFKDASGTFEKGLDFKETLRNDKWWLECSSRGGKKQGSVCVSTLLKCISWNVIECFPWRAKEQPGLCAHFLSFYSPSLLCHRVSLSNSRNCLSGTRIYSWEWDHSSSRRGAILYLQTFSAFISDSREMQAPITISKHTVPLAEIMQCPFYCSNVNIYQEKTRKYDLTQED